MRIIVFYVLALIAIMAVTPWRDVVPGKSPFVELFVLAQQPARRHAAARQLVTTVSAILFMFVWSLILLSYMAYRRQRASLHEASRYKMPGGVAMCWA